MESWMMQSELIQMKRMPYCLSESLCQSCTVYPLFKTIIRGIFQGQKLFWFPDMAYSNLSQIPQVIIVPNDVTGPTKAHTHCLLVLGNVGDASKHVNQLDWFSCGLQNPVSHQIYWCWRCCVKWHREHNWTSGLLWGLSAFQPKCMTRTTWI